MFYYAQIDEKNICVGISQLSGEVVMQNMIPIGSVDGNLIGKRFNNGTWEENSPHPELILEPPLSSTEQTLMQMAVNMEYLATMMEFKQ